MFEVDYLLAEGGRVRRSRYLDVDVDVDVDEDVALVICESKLFMDRTHDR